MSLESLLQRLVAKGTELVRTSPPPSDEKVPTSIRLKPATKQFLEAQSFALNTSIQGLIALILDGVAEATTDKPTATLRTTRERFFYLFDTHRIDLPGVVSVLRDQGFTLSALENPARLLDLLHQTTIRHIATTFSVRAEWLSAASDRVVESGQGGYWYKNTYGAARKLLTIPEELQPHVFFVRRIGADFEAARLDDDRGNGATEPIGLVVRHRRKTPDGVVFETYEPWKFERWNYAPCREQIKTLIVFCMRARLSFSGCELRGPAIDALVNGRLLPAAIMQQAHSVGWYPEDYVGEGGVHSKEPEEVPGVQRLYRESGLEGLIEENLNDLRKKRSDTQRRE